VPQLQRGNAHFDRALGAAQADCHAHLRHAALEQVAQLGVVLC
jgi:hypothetical protein